MRENKCPCCGVIVMVLSKGTIECFKCPFVCAVKDFTRIAAAMELAKAEVAASNAVWSVPLERVEATVEAGEDMLFQAKMRVLEVFNG